MLSKVEVKTFVIELLCDNCSGRMQREPYVLPTAPPQYVYLCADCGAKQQLFDDYPKTVYEKQHY